MTFQQLILDFFTHFNLFSENIDLLEKDDSLYLNLTVPDHLRGLFIGHHASTLDSFQLILALMINNRRSQPRRILLDVNGYRQEREQQILAQANALAQEVLATGVAKPMPPLSPTERRLVHLYFKDHDQITTYSQGEGLNRRLFLSPAHS